MESLRDKIAVVFQDNFLFEGTIRDNITLGKENASDEEIAPQRSKWRIWTILSPGLENGVDTEIGERGALLSGGQRQRLAIARAFIKMRRLSFWTRRLPHWTTSLKPWFKKPLTT